MSEYSGIRGTRVKYLASDPTLNTSTEGQVWYNSIEGTLKSLVQIKAFSSATNTPSARAGAGGAGIQTAGLYFGGYTSPPITNQTTTDEYSGYTWSTGGALGTARRFISGTGTQTAGLGFGGFSPASSATEEYDGSTWTAGGSLITAGFGLGSAGTQTAGLAFGGSPYPTNGNKTEEYDGSSWTAGGNLNTFRGKTAGCGTQTSALGFGGYNPIFTPSATAATEEYNGTSWTTVNSMNLARGELGGCGIQTNALVAGGGTGSSPYVTGITEEYDGTNWTTSPATLGTSRSANVVFGTRSAAVSAGGTSPSVTAATEEYNSNINAITKAVWSSGGTLATSRNRIGGAGTQTAGLAFGGAVSPGGGEPTVSTATEEYNGSSWTSGGALGTARYGVKGCGIQTAGLAVGGVINPNSAPGATRDTEEYNGSSWTASSDTNNNFYLDGVAGTQTAAVSRSGAGGPPGPAGNYTEEYNGATWTTVPATTGTARYAGSFIGTQTAAIYCGGQPPTPAGFLSDTYDGTSFSSAPSMVLQFARGGGAGTQTDAIVFAPSTASVNAQQYDGISWVTSANMATERNSVADSPAATASAALAAGGGPGVKNNTEEFTGGTEVATASTLTTS
jgi:hypothetical protein